MLIAGQSDPKPPKSKRLGGKTSHRILIFIFLLGIFVLAGLLIAIANYRFSDFFEPEFNEKIAGDATLTTLITINEDMTAHWLPNDLVWPTVFLDNPQNFQLGQLEVLRYAVRVLRDNLSRLRTTDRIDQDANSAYTNFSNDPLRWMLPSAESKYKAGLANLKSFQMRLETGGAHFYPRGDNLIELLNQLNSLLGGVCTRLATIPDDHSEFLSEETAGDIYTEGELKVNVRVPWSQIDDRFYFSQGVAYSMRQMMMAVRADFREILKLKRATELLDNIVLVFSRTQWEPKYMVLNCTPGSFIPCQNDPMMLNSRLQDARQKIDSLIRMIQD